MIHGLYLSAQGANAQIVRQDVISNNLANASTTGFKRDVAEFRFYEPDDLGRNIPARLQGQRENAVGAITLDRTTTIHTDASLQHTGRDYDLAIQAVRPDQTSDGFLRVRSPNGQDFLTRSGQLSRDPNGFLVSGDTGYPVLNVDRVPFTVPPGQIRITEDGTVQSIDETGAETPVDRIGLFTAPFDELRKAGRNLFEADPQRMTDARNARVIHGSLEASGVEPTRELVSLIDASRTFEANVNMLRMQDESLGRLLQSFSG